MLTDGMAAVDGRRNDLPGLWLSVSDLAKTKGLTKQAVSKNLARWAAAGATVSTRREGRSLLVNVAEYDRAHGETADATKVNAAQLQAGNGDPVLAREQARRTAYEADLKKLELEERLGALVPIDEVRRVSVASAHVVVRVLQGLSLRAEEVHAAGKDGVAGTRGILKKIEHDLREACADEFVRLPTALTEPDSGSHTNGDA